MPAASRLTAWLVAAAVIVLASGCGSSSHTSRSSTTTASATVDTSPAGGPSIKAVEHALLTHGGTPEPTQATCHVASTAERAASPFGTTKLPIFVCELTLRGVRAPYAVQVLRNGCFVAERTRPGQAVYGCGVARS